MGDGFRQFSIGLTKPEVSSIQYWIDETRDFVNWIDETSSACGENEYSVNWIDEFSHLSPWSYDPSWCDPRLVARWRLRGSDIH